MKKLIFLLLLCSCSGQWNVFEENDIFTPPGENHDTNYTQGLKITRTDEDGVSNGIGQTIFTPVHKQLTNPIPTERPYAGYLFAEHTATELPSSGVQNTFRYQLGIVGPHSYAQQAQDSVHRLIGDALPQGWDHQLHDEPAANIFVEQKRRADLYDNKYFSIDTIGNYGIDLGNVSTLTRVGAMFRLGVLPADFGPVVITPRAKKPGTEISYYVFTGSESRAVARNIFLDGNTFESSASVNKKPLVADIKGGFCFAYDKYQVTYTLVHITEEWDNGGSHNFGSINLGWEW